MSRKRKAKAIEVSSDEDDFIPNGETLFYNSLIYTRLDAEDFDHGKMAAQCFKTCDNCKSSAHKICKVHLKSNFEAYLQFSEILTRRNINGHSEVIFAEDRHDLVIMKDMPTSLRKNWIAIQVAGDGNCGVSAVSTALITDPVLGKALRRCCLLEYLTNKASYEKQVKAYEERKILPMLTDDGAWINGFVLFILSKVIQRPIVVVWKEVCEAFYCGYNACGSRSVQPPIVLYNYKPGTSQAHFVPLFPREKDDVFQLFLAKAPPLPPFREGNLRGKELAAYNDANPHSVKSALKIFQQAKKQTSNSHSENNAGSCEDSKTSSWSRKEDKTSDEKANEKNLTDDSKQFQLISTKDNKTFQLVLSELEKKLLTVDFSNSFNNGSVLNLTVSFWQWLQFVSQALSSQKRSQDFIKAASMRVFRLQRFIGHARMLVNTFRQAQVPPDVICEYQVRCTAQFSTEFPAEIPMKHSASHHSSPKSSASHQDDNVDHNNMQNETKTSTKKSETKNQDFHSSSSPSSSSSSSFSSSSKSSGKVRDGDKKKHVSSDEVIISSGNENEDGKNCDPSGDPGNEDQMDDSERITLETQEICDVLGISKSAIKYQPPISFKIKVKSNQVEKHFDFKRNKFKRRIWPDAIDSSMRKVQKTCSFNARSSPYYFKKKSRGFCRLQGKCSGDCKLKFNVTFSKPPQRGKAWEGIVRCRGVFSLLQSRKTGRRIGGLKRKKIAKLLKNGKKQYNVFVKRIHSIKPLNLLHKNQTMRNTDVLRKVKSEAFKKERKHQNPMDELRHVREKFCKENQPTSIVHGSIQHCNTDDDALSIHLYEEKTLHLHSGLMRRKKVELYIDATGSICRNRGQKQIYLYLALAVASDGTSFPLTFMLSEKHNNVDIGYWLGNVRHNINKLKPDLNMTSMAKIALCDFSYAMIHAILDGINKEKLADYIKRCWKVLNKKEVWPADRSCVYICSSHFIKAMQRSLFRKVKGHSLKQRKQIKELALHAAGKLIECANLDEFKEVSRLIFRVFGKKRIDLDELQECETALKSELIDAKVVEGSEVLEENESLEEEEEEAQTHYIRIRDISKFHQLFVEIKSTVLNQDQGSEENLAENPYFSDEVVSIFSNDKIAMWPFWSAAIPQQIYGPTFTNLSNAYAENEFDTIKNKYLQSRQMLYSDLVKELVVYYRSKHKRAAEIFTSLVPNPTGTKSKPKKEQKEEKWQRRRRSRYLLKKTASSSARKPKPGAKKTNQTIDDDKDPASSTATSSASTVGNPDNVTRFELRAPSLGFPILTEENVGASFLRLPIGPITYADIMTLKAVYTSYETELLTKRLGASAKSVHWLTDPIISGFLLMITDIAGVGNVTLTPHETMQILERKDVSCIFRAAQGAESYYDLKEVHQVFLPFNLQGNHWVLLALLLRDKVIQVLDPSGPFQVSSYHKKSLEEFFNGKLGLPQSEKWKVTEPLAKRMGTEKYLECGPYICFYVEALVCGWSLEDVPNMEDYRHHIFAVLTGSCQPSQPFDLDFPFCDVCYLDVADDERCSFCNRKAHKTCLRYMNIHGRDRWICAANDEFE